jgi:N-acetylmuramoyl-L-alanine amidase
MIRVFSIIFLLSFFLNCLSKAQTSRKIDSLDWLVQQNARLYVDPEGRIKGFYSIDNTGVSIYASPENKVANKVEFKVFWDEVTLLRDLIKKMPNDAFLKLYQAKNSNKFADSLYTVSLPSLAIQDLNASPKPLKGFRIAVDPGHVSGDMETAALELKFLKLKKDTLAGLNDSINLIEGNLTLATALFLKKQLENAGAEVMMTRSLPNHSAFGITYAEWLKKAKRQYFETAYNNGEISLAEKNRFIKYGSPKDIFQNYFRFADLYERARLINDYKPDFTVVIHYNVDEKNAPWTKPTAKNYNMVFVPGDLKPVFLKRVENRVELLRLLVSEDLPKSIELGQNLVKSFEKTLAIPTAQPHHASYLKNDCSTTRYSGVYVRNLALTRLVHGPIAYGETLYQDNLKECHLLADLALEIGGIKTSERIKQVSEAYYQGIVDYALGLRRIK